MTENELTRSHLAQDSVLLVIRIHSPETADPAALYEKVRKWWRMSRVQAERAARVLAVIEGKVAEVYTPMRWLDAPTEDADGRIGFVGDVAADRARWVGVSVAHLFKAGAANPVRYLPAGALDAGSIVATGAEHGDLALLLRLNQSWHEAISPDELYEVTRAWWVLSPTNAERVVRVLAVAGGLVREVYEPTDWLPSPVPGLENRIGFNGAVAADRATYVGRDVTHLFRLGSANPVRYLPLTELLADRAITSETTAAPAAERSDTGGLVEPGLLERVLPLLTAFEDDLLWAQSRAGQELFHSNTIAWLLRNHSQACVSLLDLLGGATYRSVNQVDVWRERRNLDIVIDPVGAQPKAVVENKLYSIPYPAQLTKYNAYPVPWSISHGDEGATDTRYVLLSLMTPSFPLPAPWVHVTYHDLADALDLVDEGQLGRTSDVFVRYRALVHRLVALAEAVDPAQAPDEQFSVVDVVAHLPGGGLDGAIAKMRFSGLAQAIQPLLIDPKSFELDGARGGCMTYWRRLAENRRVGWQFQENQIRLQITVEDPELQHKGNEAARAAIVEAEHHAFFDHTEVEAILGSELRKKTYTPGQWNHFNPDFVYRHRPVKPSVSTALLAQALAQLTRQVDEYADKSGYTPSI
jgi:hypothetical protein